MEDKPTDANIVRIGFSREQHIMPVNGWVDIVRDIGRILVPVGLGAIYGYLLATGSDTAEQFRDVMLTLLTLYFGVDGVARALNKRRS